MKLNEMMNADKMTLISNKINCQITKKDKKTDRYRFEYVPYYTASAEAFKEITPDSLVKLDSFLEKYGECEVYCISTHKDILTIYAC